MQFHHIMEKLQHHLFEVDPIQIEFKIGKKVTAEKRLERMFYQLPVDCFSASQQKQLDFFVKYNYEMKQFCESQGEER